MAVSLGVVTRLECRGRARCKALDRRMAFLQRRLRFPHVISLAAVSAALGCGWRRGDAGAAAGLILSVLTPAGLALPAGALGGLSRRGGGGTSLRASNMLKLYGSPLGPGRGPREGATCLLLWRRGSLWGKGPGPLCTTYTLVLWLLYFMQKKGWGGARRRPAALSPLAGGSGAPHTPVGRPAAPPPPGILRPAHAVPRRPPAR